jgi:hypothetical protein
MKRVRYISASVTFERGQGVESLTLSEAELAAFLSLNIWLRGLIDGGLRHFADVAKAQSAA